MNPSRRARLREEMRADAGRLAALAERTAHRCWCCSPTWSPAATES